MLLVVSHEVKGTKEFNDTHALLLRLLNSSLVFAIDTNEPEEEAQTSRRRLLGVQDRVADAMTHANVLHRKFIQEASVYLSFTFETSGHQSEWMNT